MSERIGQKPISAYVRAMIRLPLVLILTPFLIFMAVLTILFIWVMDGDFKEPCTFFYKGYRNLFYIYK